VTPRRERLVQPETAMSESQSRRLAAILAADIAGYSALMGADEAHGARPQKPSGSRASDGW
jgi:class 3 adenylate cyclase